VGFTTGSRGKVPRKACEKIIRNNNNNNSGVHHWFKRECTRKNL
jgi:hypothetical protein